MPNTPIIRGNPCEKLKNNIDTTPGLKNKILDLNKPENFQLDWEIGAVIQDNAQGQSGLIPKEGNAGETFINVMLSETGEITGFVHVHFEGSIMSPVFSFEDLKLFAAMYQWRAYNNKPLDKLVMVVVSKEGTFAMVIEDMALFNTQAYKIWGAEEEDLARKYKGDLNKKTQVIYETVIAQVAKVLPTHGIGLYKASAGLNIWKKVVYNPLTDKAEEVACN